MYIAEIRLLLVAFSIWQVTKNAKNRRISVADHIYSKLSQTCSAISEIHVNTEDDKQELLKSVKILHVENDTISMYQINGQTVQLPKDIVIKWYKVNDTIVPILSVVGDLDPYKEYSVMPANGSSVLWEPINSSLPIDDDVRYSIYDYFKRRRRSNKVFNLHSNNDLASNELKKYFVDDSNTLDILHKIVDIDGSWYPINGISDGYFDDNAMKWLNGDIIKEDINGARIIQADLFNNVWETKSEQKKTKCETEKPTLNEKLINALNLSDASENKSKTEEHKSTKRELTNKLKQTNARKIIVKRKLSNKRKLRNKANQSVNVPDHTKTHVTNNNMINWFPINESYIFINRPKIDATIETKLIIHGFGASALNPVTLNVAKAYHEKKIYNVLLVNAHAILKENYFKCVQNARLIGKAIADLIMNLEPFGADAKKFHIIGVSLGAHAAGWAGKMFLKKNGRRIGRITGLDPAGPCFTFVHSEDRLDSNDALYVDVIHSNQYMQGAIESLGHADFYLNGGGPGQPGCWMPMCSHLRAAFVYKESIEDNFVFVAIKCKSWQHFTLNHCHDEHALLGDKSPVTSRGKFYLRTADKPPYGLGLSGTVPES